MNTLHKVIQSDDHGAVRLELTVGAKHRPVEVVVTWQELQDMEQWPEGWHEATAGSIQDATFIRQDQGTLEVRQSF